MDRTLATTTNQDEYMTAWSRDALKLIKAQVANGATETEFQLLLYTAHKYGLDPLVKQIFCVKYSNSPAAIFTSRDGFLSIAHRSGQFDGMETKALRDDTGRLIGAACRIWRKDMSHAFVVEVSLDEYASERNPNWKSRPETMIKKVAESQCLRRAFNISGIYEPGEFDKNDMPSRQTETVVDSDGVIVDEPEPERDNEARQIFEVKRPAATDSYPQSTAAPITMPSLATEKQVKFVYMTGKETGRSGDQVNTLCREKFNGRIPEELTKSEASRFIDMLKNPA